MQVLSLLRSIILSLNSKLAINEGGLSRTPHLYYTAVKNIHLTYIINYITGKGKSIMKVAVIGSRTLNLNLSNVIPTKTTKIISGGATGIDTCAKIYAIQNSIEIEEICPDYARYARKAPLYRNKLIVDAADYVIAVWDGVSTGTLYTINYARKRNKPVRLIILKRNFNQAAKRLTRVMQYHTSKSDNKFVVMDDVDMQFLR